MGAKSDDRDKSDLIGPMVGEDSVSRTHCLVIASPIDTEGNMTHIAPVGIA